MYVGFIHAFVISLYESLLFPRGFSWNDAIIFFSLYIPIFITATQVRHSNLAIESALKEARHLDRSLRSWQRLKQSKWLHSICPSSWWCVDDAMTWSKRGHYFWEQNHTIIEAFDHAKIVGDDSRSLGRRTGWILWSISKGAEEAYCIAQWARLAVRVCF